VNQRLNFPARVGWTAPDFSLTGVDGNQWNLAASRGAMGLVVAFIANDCPYVKPIRGQLNAVANQLKAMGIGMIAINSNDPAISPDDSLPYMRALTREFNFSFPYLVDDKQIMAKAFGAETTPDFFGFNALMELQYRGRLGLQKDETIEQSELMQAMHQIALTGQGPREQIASIGCKIKGGNPRRQVELDA